jgi:hypothetical protein
MSPELGSIEIIHQDESAIWPLLRQLFEHLGTVATDKMVGFLDLESAQP